MAVFTARTSDLVGEELEGGLVLYDTRSDEAHYLDPTTTAVWQACASPRSVDELAVATGLHVEVCEAALDQLSERGLVVAPAVSRRVALRRVAKFGAVGAAGATILSASIPAAAAADSLPINWKA